VSEEVTRKLPARNTTIQLLTVYTEPGLYKVSEHVASNRRWKLRSSTTVWF